MFTSNLFLVQKKKKKTFFVSISYDFPVNFLWKKIKLIAVFHIYGMQVILASFVLKGRDPPTHDNLAGGLIGERKNRKLKLYTLW